jgi:hypothetical protein
VIGGDRRSIVFLGSSPDLEEGLYSGKIRSDQELMARAKDLEASIRVADGREKVWRSGDVLVGEVTEISPLLERRRRIYIAPGAHLIAEIEGGEMRIMGSGKAGCVVFGNRFTQKLASEGVSKAKGRADEALIRKILDEAAARTASVSREFTVLRTDIILANPEAEIRRALEEDCRKNGWRLCGLQ